MRPIAIAAALALLFGPQGALAQPVPTERTQVRLQWIGNDLTGGVLVSRVRGLLAASANKREAYADIDGLSVIVQTMAPETEWQDKVAAQKRMTVYSLTITQLYTQPRYEIFASAALGYCALADVANCAREIIDAMDEQIARRAVF